MTQKGKTTKCNKSNKMWCLYSADG